MAIADIQFAASRDQNCKSPGGKT